MKIFCFSLFLSFLATLSFSQGLGTYQDFAVNVNNQNRTFKLYTPPGVNPSEPKPVVLVFHGFSGTSGSMIQLTEFYQAADTAGFYVVYPQGQIVQDLLVNAGSNYGWDIPFISTGPNDDLAFVDEIIDTLFNSNSFNIDLNKVYACGFSNGGNFSFYLSCAKSDKIAAVAGVASGLHLKQMEMNCNGGRNISALQMFGTGDNFLPIVPANFGSIDSTAMYWAQRNSCDQTPVVTFLENKDPGDGSTVTLKEFQNCSGDLEVLFYQINNGAHVWPGGQDFPTAVVNFDIDASDEIWKFFSRHTLDEKTTSIVYPENYDQLKVYPNPFVSDFQIEINQRVSNPATVRICDLSGNLIEVIRTNLNSGENIISAGQNLKPGFYILIINSENGTLFHQKILKF